MKRISLTPLLIAVVAACGMLLNRTATSHADGVAAAEATHAIPADDLQEQVVAAERRGLDGLKTGDVAGFGKLTADEAVFVDDRGPATKAEVLKNVAGFRLTDYEMEDIRFVAISAGTGLVSYKITEKGNSHGHEFTAQVYVSSVWSKRGSGWVCLFSQETAVRKPPSPAAPKNQ